MNMNEFIIHMGAESLTSVNVRLLVSMLIAPATNVCQITAIVPAMSSHASTWAGMTKDLILYMRIGFS